MTLGGLLKHLALVEDDYFSRRLHGRDLGAPWDTVDWDADPDWEWRTAADDTPEQLYALWQECRRPLPRRRSPRRWPAAAWTSSPGAPGRTGGRPACGGFWST